MIKDLFQRLLARSGKSYTIDPDIPDSLIINTFLRRLIMMLRGFIKTGKKVYVGVNCSFSNTGNIHFGNNVTIESHTRLDAYAKEKVILGNGVKIGAYSNISCTSHLSKYGKGLKMGNNCAVGDFSQFGAAGGIEIGNDVIMGSYITFHSENHIFSDLSRLIREQGVSSVGIQIGNNVWVGAKVTFLDGCQVGNNTVIAAGAVVNATYPDNCVIGGIPAKILRNLT